jgi:exosome complex exonuclease DIS3/RRP44
MAARRSQSSMRLTRRGKILKIVNEHYLRDDLWCGSSLCKSCQHSPEQQRLSSTATDVTSADEPTYLIVDTNVVLHQMDLLEHKAFDNVVFLQTVLDETRHRDRRIYKRVREVAADTARHMYVFCNEHHRSTYIERSPKETPNDRNDRAIRVAARWYGAHLQGSVNVILITNDAENKNRAINEGLQCMTVKEYVTDTLAKEYPILLDLLASADSFAKVDPTEYAKHLSGAELRTALESGTVKKGTFKVSRNYWSEGFVNLKGIDSPVLIPGLIHMNRAVDGDSVAVKLLPKSQWKAPSTYLPTARPTQDETPDGEGSLLQGSVDKSVPTGMVVGIIKRNWRQYCGSLEVTDKKEGTVFFLAVDQRVPKIKIKTKQIERLMDKRLMVQIDSWPITSKYPLGHYVKTLGTMGDPDTETAVLLIEHEIETAPWSQNVMGCLPGDDWKITDAEVAKRVDLRKTRKVYSIDPPGCKDIDDALHIHPLPNGNFEVGVHIADVTHFCRPGSALDLEAQKRGTSVYLVERRIDMIPTRLSTDLCSLVGGVDRLAFSCVWELTPDAEIVDTRFHKSVISSVAALSYGDAQAMLESNDTDEMTISTKNLNNLAKALRAKRMAAGALTLASTQVKFLLDSESQRPTDVEMYKLKEANALVEEFMLLANISVAKQILEHYPSYACLRRHPTPAPKQFEPLIRAASSRGFDINAETSKHFADSLDKCIMKDNVYFNKIIRILATRCMTQAVYFASGSVEPPEYRHYGLATPVYTHFTSPIRRYADVIVHRLLANSLGIDPLPKDIQDCKHVTEICENLNHRNRMAQLAGRASAQVYTLYFFREKNVIEDALILGVRKDGIRVLVPRYGLESAIRLVDEPQDGDDTKTIVNPYTYDEEKLELRSATQTFRIFDQLRVRIFTHTNKMRRERLVVELADDEKSAAQNHDGNSKTLSGAVKRKAAASPAPATPKSQRAKSSRSSSKSHTKRRKRAK